MTTTGRLAPLDVGELRKGMYVGESERPWTDLPSILQVFVVEDDETLAILRRYCARVYVDHDRCAASADEDVLPVAAGTRAQRQDPGDREDKQRPGARGSSAQRRREAIDTERRYPDLEGLQSELDSASAARCTARRFLDETFRGLHQGASIGIGSAQSTITELLGRLPENPTAPLWLTSRNDHDDCTPTHSINVSVLVLSFCLRTQHGDRYAKVVLLNLAAEAERRSGKGDAVPARRVRSPAETGIDPGAVVAESLGIEIA